MIAPSPRRFAPEHTALWLWSLLAGLALWVPAFGIPFERVYLQPMDVLTLAGLPLLPAFWRQFTTSAFWIAAPLMGSIALSWFAMGGEILVLLWTLVFALPFVALAYLALRVERARAAFLRGFLLGATASALLFLAQIIFGAEGLDYRSNTAFSLPPQYGRGFALFPEVSTFATHAVMAFGVALAGLLHPDTPRDARQRRFLLILLLALCLMFSRSTSVIVLAPLIVGVTVMVTTRPTLNTLLLVMGLAALGTLFLTFFLSAFYADRLETSAADRSMAMRLASILGGISPLLSGEIFGLGIGENDAVRLRAHEAARALGLSFGNLPTGVNSQIIGRVFEEGWPAVVNMAIAAAMLLKGRHTARAAPLPAALYVLAVGSLLTALFVTGYRGIYTNWLWLAGAAALAPSFSPLAQSASPSPEASCRPA